MFCRKSNQSGFRSMMASNFKLLHTGEKCMLEERVQCLVGPAPLFPCTSMTTYSHHSSIWTNQIASPPVQAWRSPGCGHPPAHAHSLVRASFRQLQVNQAGELHWMRQHSGRALQLDSSWVWLVPQQGSRTSLSHARDCRSCRLRKC